MLIKSAHCGVKAVIATPHYWPWAKGVTADVICKRCKEAEERLQNEYGITMDIFPGNEIYYSSETVDALKAGKALTLGGSRYVLVEFEPEVSYQLLCRAARDLCFNGYIPIFAHVERYQALNRVDKLIELREMGAYLQVNISSLQGGLLDLGSNKVKRWLKIGLIDFVASDMHDLDTRSPMSSKSIEWIKNKLSSQYQDKLLFGNAKGILPEIKV